ncbi:MAG TPA: hemolysin family protein [Tepidisphaeraceae bacterium]|jgi:putative hemolysin
MSTSHYITVALLCVAIVASGVFATLTYSLRDFSRPRLSDALARRKKTQWNETTVSHSGELAFVTASLRLIFNLCILLGALHLVRNRGLPLWSEYLIGTGAAAAVTLVTSVMLPHAFALHAGEPIIAMFVRPLAAIRVLFRPLVTVLRATENLVLRATRPAITDTDAAEEEMQSEILAVVEEGEKTGLVDGAEREMIESVIAFNDSVVGDVMTARPDIIGLPVASNLLHVRTLIEDSGHSRIPVYEDSLDHIVGVLYARDLLRFLGETVDHFEVRQIMRAPFFVPESKPLTDLLGDFRRQKVHIAIVLDEYGGTAGLISIEDVLEELVGEISDEHEGVESATFKRLDDTSAEVDGKILVDELNRLLGTRLPDDAGYDTLGGFVSTHLGKIPEAGTVFEAEGAMFEVLQAEPQRVTRVLVRLTTAVEPAA